MINITPDDDGHLLNLINYTDDELLDELRSRGRIARVEAQNVIPGYIADSFPTEAQFAAVMEMAVREVVRVLGTHKRIPGAEVSTVNQRHSAPGYPPGRRMRLPLNVIVEKN